MVGNGRRLLTQKQTKTEMEREVKQRTKTKLNKKSTALGGTFRDINDQTAECFVSVA